VRRAAEARGEFAPFRFRNAHNLRDFRSLTTCKNSGQHNVHRSRLEVSLLMALMVDHRHCGMRDGRCTATVVLVFWRRMKDASSGRWNADNILWSCLGRLVIGIVGFVLAVILLAVSIPAASDRAMRAT